MQKLILPFKSNILSASYKNQRYKDYHRIVHYGWDMGCEEWSNAVCASGNGIVIAAGMDGDTLFDARSNLGNCIVIVYQDVQLSNGKSCDIACRMFHLEKIYAKVGQQVHAGTKLGDYGHTGGTNDTDHLHIEFDSDTRIVGGANYAQYAVGVARTGKVIKRGSEDSTLNPRSVFHLGDGQSIRGCPGNNKLDWYDKADIALPTLTVKLCPTCGRAM